MKYIKLLSLLQKKINKILNYNAKNHIFNNLNILIFKFILEQLPILEQNLNVQKNILLSIKYFLNNQHELVNNLTIYSNKQELTNISKKIILNLYQQYGFNQCFNNCLVIEYCKENHINYNLFFNQVDSENEIIIDYFKLNDNKENEDDVFDNFKNKNCYFILNNIDELEIRYYDI